MKMFRAFFAFAVSFLALNIAASAQKSSLGCIDKSIRLQADEIKRFYTDQGFVVMRDAMLNMSSMEPLPVMTELQRGQMYLFIFVGPEAVQRMNLEIFDGTDNKVTQEVAARNRQQPNYIIYHMVPERTDAFLVTLMQRLKNQDMCGSLCILKLNPDKRISEIKPYQP